MEVPSGSYWRVMARAFPWPYLVCMGATGACGGAAPTELLSQPTDDGGTTGDATRGSDGSSADATNPQDTGSSQQMPETSAGVFPIPCPAAGGQAPVTCQPNDFCCVDTGTQVGACEGTGSTCNGVPLECGKTEDCTSGVCCFTRGAAKPVVTCQADCTGGVVLCSGNADAMLCAAVGPHDTCQPSEDFNGLFGCK